jgi:hypothetical protein
MSRSNLLTLPLLVFDCRRTPADIVGIQDDVVLCQLPSKVNLISIRIPSRKKVFFRLKNQNLVDKFLYIVPAVFDGEGEKLAVDIFANRVVNGDFVRGDGRLHG